MREARHEQFRCVRHPSPKPPPPSDPREPNLFFLKPKLVKNGTSLSPWFTGNLLEQCPLPVSRAHGIPGTGPEHNRPDDWIVVKDAHPALISRALFQAARTKRESRKRDPSEYSYRTGHGAHSTFLLTGLIRCLHCGHTWQGYTTNKGRKRTDGTAVKTLGYACGGYVTKGKSCCQRVVLPACVEAS